MKIKKSKMISSLAMTLFLLIFFFIPGNIVMAETSGQTLVYTALGDSISYGYSADPGEGYVNLLYNYLKVQRRYSGLQLNNLSVPGLTTSELLDGLQSNPVLQNSIESSSIITLSIGGNNLLQPVIGAVAAVFNVSLEDPNFLADLTEKINSTPEPLRTSIFNGVITQLSTPGSDLSIALTAGVQQFNDDFPLIITQIKTLAPQAKIYMLTLYNPFSIDDPCFLYFDPLIKLINSEIINQAGNYYEVADVYTAFAGHTGTPVVNFNFLSGAVDPHPTTEGHMVIFETHVTPVSSVTLNETSKTLEIGQTLQLTAAVLPSNVITNPDVIWASSDSSIASVDDNGKVTAKASGSAVITAASVDGNKTAQCTITVTKAAAEADTSDNTLPQTGSLNAAEADTSGNTLPQTGSLLDFNTVLSLGAVILILGVMLAVKRKIRS